MRVHDGLNAQSTMQSERNQSSELPPTIDSPNVIVEPIGKSPTMAFGSVIGAPIWRQKRANEKNVGTKSWLPPVSQTTPLPPRFASTSTKVSLTSRSASSQLIRFHWP